MPCLSLKRAAHSVYTGAGKVAPAPFSVPPSWAALLSPDDDVASLPHAATVSASEPAATTAIHLRDLKASPRFGWVRTQLVRVPPACLSERPGV